MMTLRSMRGAAFALLASSAAIACSNPVSSGGHLRPNGVVVRDGTTVVAQVSGGTATGQLTVQVGQHTPRLTVQFIDAGGNAITPPTGYYLAVVPRQEGVAAWVQDAAGEFAGRLHGLAPGTIELDFEWVQGPVGSAHVDQRFTINAVVTN
ncbi:MAG TPA: hypothetical protein VK936_08060 [Longimicrobiales bacterium]|nr:hypothetical protein [Longimicrobiales bacterium]